MKLREKLKTGPLLLDGAAGTWVQEQTITPEQWGDVEGCNEWLNLSAPDIIRGLHRAYLEAGSDAIETNSFGASPVTLGEYNLVERAYEINKASATLARECAEEFSTPEQPRYVFGSIGPGTKLPSLSQISFDELLEAFRLDQLLQDRLLAHVGEVDALVRALDPLLDPGFLFRIGDVHELDAQRRAIGPLEDVEHLRNRCVFKPENMVDEDRPLEIGFGKAIGFRRKLVVVIVGLLRQIERIELGMQMAAHAVGADHHQRTDGHQSGLAVLLCCFSGEILRYSRRYSR